MALLQLGSRQAQRALHGIPGTTFVRLSRRTFSATCVARMKTSDMKEQDLKALKVNKNRLMDTLHYTCGFGTGTRWGRQAESYSPKVFP